MTTPPTAPAEVEKLFDELTEIIVFLQDEGFGFTSERLIEVRDRFRTLEAEHRAMQKSLGYIDVMATDDGAGDDPKECLALIKSDAQKTLSSLSIR